MKDKPSSKLNVQLWPLKISAEGADAIQAIKRPIAILLAAGAFVIIFGAVYSPTRLISVFTIPF